MPDPLATLKDAAYITVGFGVIAFQKAQVRRRELEQDLDSQRAELKAKVEALRDQAARTYRDIETRFEPLVDQIDDRLDELEGRLPEQARDAVRQARTAAREARAQLSALIAPAA